MEVSSRIRRKLDQWNLPCVLSSGIYRRPRTEELRTQMKTAIDQLREIMRNLLTDCHVEGDIVQYADELFEMLVGERPEVFAERKRTETSTNNDLAKLFSIRVVLTGLGIHLHKYRLLN